MLKAVIYPSIYCSRRVGEVYKKDCYKCPYFEVVNGNTDFCWRV